MPLSVSLFGDFRCTTASQQPLVFTNKRARALFAFLCLTPSLPVNRELLSRLLWPGRYNAQAKSSLRQCIFHLNKQFEPLKDTPLVISRTHLGLRSDLISTDLTQFEATLASGDALLIEESIHKIGDRRLLEDVDINEHFAAAVERQCRHIEQRLSSQVASAENTFMYPKRACDFNSVKQAWAMRTAASLHIRLVTLPFAFNASNEDTHHLVEGIRDTVNSLLRMRTPLSIVGAASVNSLLHRGKSPAEISRLLAAQYCMSGSIHVTEHECRIEAHLIDGKSNFLLWENEYTLTAYPITTEKISNFQVSVCQTLCAEVSEWLSVPFKTPAMHRMTLNHQAYDFYMQGRSHIRRIIGDGVLPTAISLLEKAVKLDEGFSKCWSALAEAYAYLSVFVPYCDKQATIQRIKDCAEKALSIDPTDGLALVMLGVSKWCDNDPLGAIDLAYNAYHYEPTNAAVAGRLGSFLCYAGLTEQALPIMQQAVDMEPLDGRHLIILCNVYINLGHYAHAREIAAKISAIGFPAMWLGLTTALAGDQPLGVKLYGQTRMIMNSLMTSIHGTKPMSEDELDTLWDIAAKGVCSGSPEAREVYCHLLDRIQTSLPDKQDISIILPAVWMGYADLVINTLKDGVTPASTVCLGYLWAPHAPTNRIIKHPKFQQLATSLGLPRVWEKYGWPSLITKFS
ncbi:hypothetical protein [Alteromonas oceanisediminis]|uniref:hypothetical protein n=1 Tax=Alteromonas oceanisediminis TaxID=2836180 RepID=UPI001BDADC86|nr:hypothetical protein [Alteromonas oceanisediminis]MBT0586141.1 hypothetical protein [Alteromonas oceanisediminis]